MILITAQCGTDLDLPERGNMGERQGELSNPENKTVTKSTRSTRGIKPILFREM